jgi:hypothetical protein
VAIPISFLSRSYDFAEQCARQMRDQKYIPFKDSRGKQRHQSNSNDSHAKALSWRSDILIELLKRIGSDAPVTICLRIGSARKRHRQTRTGRIISFAFAIPALSPTDDYWSMVEQYTRVETARILAQRECVQIAARHITKPNYAKDNANLATSFNVPRLSVRCDLSMSENVCAFS